MIRYPNNNKRMWGLATGLLLSSLLLARGGGGTGPIFPRFAYVVNSGDDTVSIYTVTANPGQLRHHGSVATGTGPRSVTVDPTGQFAYVANAGGGGNVSAYTINATTGTLTELAASPFTAGTLPQSVTVDPTGQFAYVANAGGGGNVSAYTINATTGALTEIIGSPFAAGTRPFSVVTTGTIQ